MRLLYPRNRTSVSTSRVSAKCQKETPPSGQGIGVSYWLVQRGTGRRSRESKGSRDALSGHAIYPRFALSKPKGVSPWLSQKVLRDEYRGSGFALRATC